jgi:hypothetical protein
VGGATVGFILGQRLSPALTDFVLSRRRLGVGAQTADRPDNGTDNLDAPVDEPGRTRGSYSGPVLEHSAFTAVVGHLRRPTELTRRIVRGLRPRRGSRSQRG